MAPQLRSQACLRIGSLNSAGQVATSSQQFSKLLNDVNIDLIGLQEVKSQRPLTVPGYSWIPGLDPADKPSHHLGIGFLVKKSLKGRLTVAKRNKVHEILWLTYAGTQHNPTPTPQHNAGMTCQPIISRCKYRN